MEFTYIKGFRGGSLLYLHQEKHLFYQTHNRDGRLEFSCYDNNLPKDYKSSEQQSRKCNAKVIVKEDICRRNNTDHQCHANHELVFRDLQTLNEIKERCQKVSEWCPISAHKISAKEIFMTMLAK